jgi:hypothetical protein
MPLLLFLAVCLELLLFSRLVLVCYLVLVIWCLFFGACDLVLVCYLVLVIWSLFEASSPRRGKSLPGRV